MSVRLSVGLKNHCGHLLIHFGRILLPVRACCLGKSQKRNVVGVIYLFKSDFTCRKNAKTLYPDRCQDASTNAYHFLFAGDSCWERRLRCVLRLFLLSLNVPCASPVILEIVTLPCLKILRGLISSTKLKPKVVILNGCDRAVVH